MSNAASNYLELTTLKHILRNASTNGAEYDTSTLDVYVSLHTGSPAEDDSGSNEIPTSGYNYAREQVTFGDVATVANVTSASSNVTVTFGQASQNYPADVTHIGMYDAATGGSLLFYGALANSKQITAGDVFQINSGSLTITLD